MKVVKGDFKKNSKDKHKVVDMLEALRDALGTFEDDNPEVAVESACVIFIEGKEFVLASNGLHPDTVNMLLDIGKYQLIMGGFESEESYDGPVH
jgi:hypothetical protein